MFDVHEMEVNFGPQHPSTHGVLRVLLKIDGERIIDAKPIIGYLHTGMEKTGENLTYRSTAVNCPARPAVTPCSATVAGLTTIQPPMALIC